MQLKGIARVRSELSNTESVAEKEEETPKAFDDEALMETPWNLELIMLKVVCDGYGVREGRAVGMPLKLELVMLRVSKFERSITGVGEVAMRS